LSTILTRKPGPRVARSIGAVAAKYEKHPKTVGDRWIRQGVVIVPGEPRVKFPDPDLVLNGVRHWFDETTERFDAQVKAVLEAARKKANTETPPTAGAGGGVSVSTEGVR
jgi:hypothetical protein